MMTTIIQIMLCGFVMGACIYSFISENRRTKALNEFIDRMNKVYWNNKK